MKVKVCGISSITELQTCVDQGADFCGFILNYSKSHRFISIEKAKILTSFKKKKSKYVGVLVNPSLRELENFSKLELDYFQIYGSYNDKQILDIKNKFGKKIIVAIQVKKKDDVKIYKNIKNTADIILWDSAGMERSIGWNYDWINSVPKNITKMLAGNIDIYKLEQISKLTDIVDVSGALETNKVKDVIKIKKFLKKVKQINDKD